VKVVWILNHYAVLPDESGSTRHYLLAKGILNEGWQTIILASSFSHWNKLQRFKGFHLFQDRTEKSIIFRFIKTPGYLSNNLLRILNMVAYFLNILIPASTSGLPRPDIIVGSSVHPLAALAAALLAKKYHVPFVFEVRDLWPETLIAMNRILENGFVANLLGRLERFLYTRADKIIVLLPNAHTYIEKFNVNTDKIKWIPNGVAINNSSVTVKRAEVFTIMYLGSHGEANAIEIIIEAIKLLRTRPLPVSILFRFIGEGEMKEKLINMAKEYGLENVSFEQGVPKNDVSDILSEADAFLISVRNLPRLYQYGVSMNKIYEYMSNGKPVICALSAANNPVKEANAGITVEAENPILISDAIEKLITMSDEERSVLGRNGRSYVKQNHDYKILAQSFNNILNELI